MFLCCVNTCNVRSFRWESYMYKNPSLAPPKISLPSDEKATENIQNLRLVFTRHRGICFSGSPLTEHKCTETKVNIISCYPYCVRLIIPNMLSLCVH